MGLIDTKITAIGSILFTITIGMMLSLPNYSGSKLTLVFFHFSFVVLLLSISHRQHLYVFTFASAFLFLGFWVKFIFHHLLGNKFVEPIGAFNNSPEAWDRALLVASTGVVGFALPKILISLIKRDSTACTMKSIRFNEFYKNNYTTIWLVISIFFGFIFAWNYQVGFYQIGVKPKMILPFYLNAFLAWLVNYGIFFSIAIFVNLENERSPKNLEKSNHYVIVAGLIGSLSTISRSFYIFATFPFLLVACFESKSRMSKMARLRLATFFMVSLGISLLAVQTIRSQIYFLTMQSDVKRRAEIIEKRKLDISYRLDATNHINNTDHVEINENIAWMKNLPTKVPDTYRSEFLGQISSLFLGRWTGLEGVLAVSAHNNRGSQLFIDGMLESPEDGNRSLYQGIAKAKYSAFDELIFLTLPGIIAVLYYSGSLVVVFLGMATVSLVMIVTESAINAYVDNSYLSALIGIQTAYVVCQLTYPYLCIIYFLLLWLFIGVLFAGKLFGLQCLTKFSKIEPKI